MPETQHTPATTDMNSPAPWFLPWWLPGVLTGLLFASIAFLAVQFRPTVEPKYKAEALVQLPPGESEAKRRNSAWILGSRDLVARVVAEPAVAALPSVRAAQDPAAEIAARLAVTEAAPDVLAVTLTGDAPDDMKVILDHLAKHHVDDSTAFERKKRQEQIKALQQLSETNRREIEAREAHIELLSKANDTAGGDDNAVRLALHRRRHAGADDEFVKVSRNITKLEAELEVLNRKAMPPDPARSARVALLATEIEVQKIVRENFKTERDELQKLLASGVSGGFNVKSMRDSLELSREQQRKVDSQLFDHRMAMHLDSRASVRGEPSVTPVRAGSRLTTAGLWAGGAFAAGFALATALSLVGLTFRVLRRFA